ncbi:MAG TPA: bi-domain-containing oxidoreductase [Steroidobacteraceae bacterium]|jgi:predicted dehydrogenase
MQQLLQSLADGRVFLESIPVPAVASHAVLIRTNRSLISAGTERMLLEFGRANLISKVRQQPERVRQVLNKMRTDGVAATLEAVRGKLEQPIPLGYCNVGRVVECGGAVTEFASGDRVISNGSHAEFVAVGRNLCARVPDSVSDEEAAFVPLAAIALQGMRLAALQIGESVCVIGLGLVGLIAVQLLKASGCRVLGIDLDPAKLELARQFGAEVVQVGAGDVLKAAEEFSGGRGIDAVLIAAATDSNEPIRQAAQMCRQRGRVVLIGVTGLELDRNDFYKKEISFQVSCSYGPGRYDEDYEGRGNDYPFGLVRWTEQRNFEAVLTLLDRRAIELTSLISHRFAFSEAGLAYDLLADRSRASLGILLEYGGTAEAPLVRSLPLAAASPSLSPQKAAVGFIGAGNYAGRVLIPAFKESGARLIAIASANGVNSVRHGRDQGFEFATTEVDSVLNGAQINLVVIATRHSSHAQLVERALSAGKHVFVEKPLALSAAEADGIERAYRKANQVEPRLLMVGFNRRFAPLAVTMKSLLDKSHGAKSFVVTVNAGAMPSGHWTLEAEGGGRIIGEACHFIDFLRFLSGHPITDITALSTARGGEAMSDPSVSINLKFSDGSMGLINYITSGHASFPKERIEVFAAGAVLQLDNFRQLRGFGWPGFRSQRLWRQDKGQRACAAALVRAIEAGTAAPIPIDELLEVSRATIAASEAARH